MDDIVGLLLLNSDSRSFETQRRLLAVVRKMVIADDGRRTAVGGRRSAVGTDSAVSLGVLYNLKR